MFHIGGEQEVTKKKFFRDITNSGRSSLRLIIKSAGLQGKRLLLPSFLCEVIVDVLLEFEIEIDFYDINVNLEFKLPDDLSQYDAVYLIKYFGMANKSFQDALLDVPQCLIIDDVFSPYPHVPNEDVKWFSYNSLRKISQVADFSLIYSNFPIVKMEKLKLPLFSSLKYEAKHLKDEYLSTGKGDEREYLSLFSKAETLLNNSIGIYQASENSLCEAIEFYSNLATEKKVRYENYMTLKSMLGERELKIKAPFYSFLPVLLSNRDEVRRKLMGENIFLAIHWPDCKEMQNKLSSYIISVPLDSRYSKTDMIRLGSLIKELGSL
jgi:hypothetical protein